MPTTIPVALPAVAVDYPTIDIRDKILAVVGNRDLIVVSIFSTVGLLLSILFAAYIMIHFPNLGALIEQYNQF
jgi:hypothetical protein